MMNKKLAIACGAILLGATSMAQAELTANIGATSNYLWRGVSQTGDAAAISGGIDWAHDSGFYLGTWASNIDWGNGSGAEVDFYGGFANEIGDFGYDLGLIYYYYPTSSFDDSDFTEISATGSWKFLEAGIAYTVNGQADSDGPFSNGDIYYHISASFDVAETWSVGGTYGYYDFDTSKSKWDDVYGDPDYGHIQLDVTKSAGDWGDFTMTVSKADEESGSDDVKFLVSWGKTF
ncbi:TorF family putative porin [Thiolapillus sp.]|uniref:TorF family putative porin n=2 Tax=Thiolapillus sp. TaxID=2017437 RepID=UPI0025DCF3B6|nr:TorF family putative porin [Thiolapillus sp.]